MFPQDRAQYKETGDREVASFNEAKQALKRAKNQDVTFSLPIWTLNTGVRIIPSIDTNLSASIDKYLKADYCFKSI